MSEALRSCLVLAQPLLSSNSCTKQELSAQHLLSGCLALDDKFLTIFVCRKIVFQYEANTKRLVVAQWLLSSELVAKQLLSASYLLSFCLALDDKFFTIFVCRNFDSKCEASAKRLALASYLLSTCLVQKISAKHKLSAQQLLISCLAFAYYIAQHLKNVNF